MTEAVLGTLHVGRLVADISLHASQLATHKKLL